MNKIKVLFFSFDFSCTVSRNELYFANELSKYADLKVTHQSGDINKIMEELGFKPDFILLNDLNRCPAVTGMENVSIPKGLIIADIHWQTEQRKKYILDNKIGHLFSHCRDMFYKTYSELASRFHWFPHFIDPSIFDDYAVKKEIDYLLMGDVNHFYPLRQKILATMKGMEGFVYHPHPGYQRLSEEELKTCLVGQRYAVEINRAKIFFTCDSKYHYPIKKYYEVLGCRTLLLASSSKELQDLGFIPGVTFVEIDENNFLEKARYYLQHEEERNYISQRGYEMVQNNHTVAKRVQEFINTIKQVI